MGVITEIRFFTTDEHGLTLILTGKEDKLDFQ